MKREGQRQSSTAAPAACLSPGRGRGIGLGTIVIALDVVWLFGITTR